jgi:hypothetical protein
MSHIICRQCNRVGHYAEDCRTPNDKLPKFKQHSTSTQYANANDQDDDQSDFEYVFTALQQSESRALMASNYSFQSEYEDAWLLDIGATQHMTFRRDLFWSFHECKLNSIFLADDTMHTPRGKGSVKVFFLELERK